jgi:hypothetical protein
MEKLLGNKKFVRIGSFAGSMDPSEVAFGYPMLPEPKLDGSVE